METLKAGVRLRKVVPMLLSRRKHAQDQKSTITRGVHDGWERCESGYGSVLICGYER